MAKPVEMSVMRDGENLMTVNADNRFTTMYRPDGSDWQVSITVNKHGGFSVAVQDQPGSDHAEWIEVATGSIEGSKFPTVHVNHDLG